MLAESTGTNQSSDYREKQRTDRNSCRFFNSKRGCRFGEKCRFKHEVLNSESGREQEEEAFEHLSASEHQHDFLETKLVNTLPVDSAAKELEVDSTDEVNDGDEKKLNHDPNEDVQEVCRHFSRLGWCRFGKHCRFAHPKRARGRGAVKQGKVTSTKDFKSRPRCENASFEELKTKDAERPEIRREEKLACRFGNFCQFKHNGSAAIPETKKDNSEVSLQSTDPLPPFLGKHFAGVGTARRNPSNPAKSRSDLSSTDIKSLKKTECDQLKKRFPVGKLEIIYELGEESSYKFEFTPTDPDWPFDIRTFNLEIRFPSKYPLELFSIGMCADDIMPQAVRRYIEIRVAQWLEEKQKQLIEMDRAELVFRPFLRWLDRNLEDIVTEGLRQYQRELAAKAAGFEFIPAKIQPETDQKKNDESPITLNEETGSSVENTETESNSETESDEMSDNEDEVTNPQSNDYSNVERKGTEVLLKNLQLKDGTATILIQKLAIIVQCGRCKNTTEFSTPGGRLNSIPCGKCHNDQRLVYRPAMAHHFSAVVGYLDLADCQPYDLILQDCVGTMSCLNCSRENKLEGLVPGQVKQTWCQRCHQKLSVAAESVRFQQLQPSELKESAVHQVKVSKTRRVIRDPAIQEGKPLPGEGTCKHYKKSFRWLRFPCCGKCYPCDICHDEKEGDHEMKFASRMICGFCCKEQPYTTEKPCVLCGSQLTKTRSSHWEGGRGCRDKIRMSRYDGQKYANMSKTVSKKAKAKQDAKKPGSKTTKLRHA